MNGDVTVREVMTREYVGVSESDTVLGAVRLMREAGSGGALVLRGSDPVGILTEWDVLGLVADEGDPAETEVSERMSSPVLSVASDRGVADAARLMAGENVRRLVVTSDDASVARGASRPSDRASGPETREQRTSRTDGTVVDGDEVRGLLTERDVIAASGSRPTLNENVENGPADSRARTDETADTRYSAQGICEVCGTLTRDLGNFNGQLICSNCREV